MGTVIFIAVCAWIFFLLFKKFQNKQTHEILYAGDRTEEEILAVQARQRSRIAAKLWGAVLGAVGALGIAAFGGAIAGTIPGAILGWYIAGHS